MMHCVNSFQKLHNLKKKMYSKSFQILFKLFEYMYTENIFF